MTLTMIVDTPVDTCDGDVKLASAQAVAAALGGQLEPAPYLDAHGAVFPARPATKLGKAGTARLSVPPGSPAGADGAQPGHTD
ncbi:hypothetical protein [Micromonospora sp. CPCC 205556]|uniref:hypothetical protein n=1 Tax=Micromonospora sp. CPCC 205556 TaxID=3122398 RepID=UPI002FF0F17F